MGPNPTGRTPSEPNTQSFNPALERLREAGYDGRPGLAEANKELALAVGELSNIAAEAITLLESPAVSAWLREVHRDQIRDLRGRLEEACRYAS